MPTWNSPDTVNKRARIKAYLPRLYGYALSLARDHCQAEDLVQECALRSLKARNIPGDERAYRAWLFRILRNVFLDQKRQDKSVVSFEEAEHSASGTEYWQGDERFITSLTVGLELAKLPSPQREIIGLIDVAGFTYAEAAQILDVPVGTVMSRISRARRKLLDAVGSSNVQELPVKRRKGSG